MPHKISKDGMVRICLYDAERHFRRNNGEKINDQIVAKIPSDGLSKRRIAFKVRQIREAQKEKNRIFKERMRINRIKGILEAKSDFNEKKFKRRRKRFAVDVDSDFLEETKDTDVPITQKDKELGLQILSKSASNIDKALQNIRITNGLKMRLDLGTGNTTFILGSSKRGKTTLMMWLYRKHYKSKKFITTLFSINSQIRAYKGEKRLLRCSSFSRLAQKYIKLEKFINRKTGNRYQFANLIDDVIDIRHNRLINNMILTYRNSNISTVMCMQYSNLLSKSSRANINNVLIFGFNSTESIEVVIKTFLRSVFVKIGLKKLDDQIRFFQEVTVNHQFMYYHPVSNTLTFHKINIKKNRK